MYCAPGEIPAQPYEVMIGSSTGVAGTVTGMYAGLPGPDTIHNVSYDVLTAAPGITVIQVPFWQ